MLSRLQRVLVDAAASAPKRALPPHPGTVQHRAFCPRGCNDVYPTLARYGNGDVRVFCCLHRDLTRLDWQYPEFLAAFDV